MPKYQKYCKGLTVIYICPSLDKLGESLWKNIQDVKIVTILITQNLYGEPALPCKNLNKWHEILSKLRPKYMDNKNEFGMERDSKKNPQHFLTTFCYMYNIS